jgi:hypothetical protein
LREETKLQQRRKAVWQAICASREAIQITRLAEAKVLAKHYAALNFWFFSSCGERSLAIKRKEQHNALTTVRTCIKYSRS